MNSKYLDFDFFIKELINSENDAWKFFQNKYINYIYKCMISKFRFFALQPLQEDLEDCYGLVIERIWIKINIIPSHNEKVFKKSIATLTKRVTHLFITRVIFKKEEYIEDFDKKIFEKKLKHTFPKSLDIAPDIPLAKKYDFIEFFEICNKILTKDENMVIKLKAAGFTEYEIADILKKKRPTVRKLFENAKNKINKYYKNNDKKLK